MLLRRGALLFFKAIRQISRSHGSKIKSLILTQNWHFQTVTPVWIHQWLWNDAQILKQHRRGALLFFKVIHQISRSHRTKKLLILIRIERFWNVTPVWIQWLHWNNGLSLPWYRRSTLLFFEVIHKFSRSHGTKKSLILTRIAHFRTVIPIWIYPRLWDDAQSLM